MDCNLPGDGMLVVFEGGVAQLVWLRESLRANKPYDQFARELITASGSGFRNGPVNWYVTGDFGADYPLHMASQTSQVFLGLRIDRPPFSDPRVREAFDLALDREELITLGGLLTQISGALLMFTDLLSAPAHHCDRAQLHRADTEVTPTQQQPAATNLLRDCRDGYLAAHLPGAVYLDLPTALSGRGEPTDGRHPLPTPEQFTAALGAAGGAVPAVG